MNVPPLCTVAVSASAQAPRPRLPRKKPSEELLFVHRRLGQRPQPDRSRNEHHQRQKHGDAGLVGDEA